MKGTQTIRVYRVTTKIENGNGRVPSVIAGLEFEIRACDIDQAEIIAKRVAYTVGEMHSTIIKVDSVWEMAKS